MLSPRARDSGPVGRLYGAALALGALFAACGASSRPTGAPVARAVQASNASEPADIAVVLENHISPAFRPVSVELGIDGEVVLECGQVGRALDTRTLVVLWRGPVAPGVHRFAARLELRGHGYGVFSYLRNYRFRTSGQLEVPVPPGARGTLRVVASELGGPATPIEDRPHLDLRLHLDQAPGEPANGCPYVDDDAGVADSD